MKRIFCFCRSAIMILVLLAGSAYAGDLRDTWEQLEYIYDLSAYGYIAEENVEGWIDGVPIGSLAKNALERFGCPGSASAEDLVAALACNEYCGAAVLDDVAAEIGIAEVCLIDSDLTTWWNNETGACSWDEFYLISATLYYAEGEKDYGILVYFWGDEDVGQDVESTVIYEDYTAYEFDFTDSDTYLGDMYIVNCEDWVSLRSWMDTDADCLAKVPKGALVENACILDSGDFALCYYQGQMGYILKEYLGYEKEEEPVYPTYCSTSYGYGTTVMNGVNWYDLASNDGGIHLLDYSASSRLKDSERTYPASNLFDGNLDNAWSDGVYGEGIGETIHAVWTAGGHPYEALGIAICNGYQKSEKIYLKNSRPRDIRVSVNGYTFSAKLIDSRDGWQSVIFDSPVGFDCEAEVTILIDSVYTGNKYEDTCITELDLLVRDTCC